MKKYLIGLLGVGLMLLSCQKAETFVDGVAESAADANVTITLSTPGALATTRGATLNSGSSSAKGGYTNVDMSDYDLRYQLAVYRVDSDGTVLAVSPQIITTSDCSDASFNLTLTPNRTYQFVAWADFVTSGSTSDLHYSTEDFTNIYCLDSDDACLNDESRDAYFICQEETISSELSLSLTLTRPFAKLRLITTDYASEGLDAPDEVSVTYYGCTRFTSLNAITGEATGETLASEGTTTYTGTLSADKEYTGGYDAEDAYRTLVVDYLLASDEQTPIHLSFSSSTSGIENLTTDISTNVPIQRNYLTTITGQLLTISGDVNVSIDDGLENDDETVTESYDDVITYDLPTYESTGSYTTWTYTSPTTSVVYVGYSYSGVE